MRQPLMSAAVLLLLLMILPDVLAQEAANRAVVANPADTFPASLGYAALGLASAAGAAMSGVIAKLWYGIRDMQKEHQVSIDQLRKDNQAALDQCRTDCRKEIDHIRDRLEKEQKERRVEAEKLLREQKDIMKEVMVTCAAVATALEENNKALERLVGMVGNG